MYPVRSVNVQSTPPRPSIYPTLLNAKFINHVVGAMHFSRNRRRPLLPTPYYKPGLSNFFFSKNNSHSFSSPYLPSTYRLVQSTPLSRNKFENIRKSSFPMNYDLSYKKSKLFQSGQCFNDTNLYSTESYLLDRINQISGQINEVEQEIAEYGKKQQIGEQDKNSLLQQEENAQVYFHPCLFQKILLDNRQKSRASHNIFNHMGKKFNYPLYNQPCDTVSYYENKRRHVLLKKQIMVFLKRKSVIKMRKQEHFIRMYSLLDFKWKINIRNVENSYKYKTNETKKREYFEKVFPELQKSIYSQEKLKRSGDHVRSEAHLEEVLCQLKAISKKEKMTKLCEAIPPILLDEKVREKVFYNQNGLIKDIVTHKKEEELLNCWSTPEKDIFKEKFIQFPKQFGIIASFIGRKSVCDCVKFYYLTKKVDNYKKLCYKSGKKKQAMLKVHHACNC